MKRENFERIVAALAAQCEREAALVKALEPFFDGYLMSEISVNFQAEVINALADEMNDPGNGFYSSWLKWWLYDAPEGGRCKESCGVINSDGKQVRLETPGDLYDFICEMRSIQ